MDEGEVVVGLAVAAGGDAAFRFQPGVGALDGEAVAGLRVWCAYASSAAAPDFACRGSFRDRIAGAAGFADLGLDRALA